MNNNDDDYYDNHPEDLEEYLYAKYLKENNIDESSDFDYFYYEKEDK